MILQNKILASLLKKLATILPKNVNFDYHQRDKILSTIGANE